MNASLYKTAAAWLVSTLAVLGVAIVTLTGAQPPIPRGALAGAALLGVGAVVSAAIGATAPRRGPHVAGLFVVTAVVVAPPQVAAAVALVAGAVCAPAVAGFAVTGVRAYAALAVAAGAAAAALSLFSPPADYATLEGLLVYTGVAAVFHGVAVATSALLADGAPRARWRAALAGDLLLAVAAWRLGLAAESADRAATTAMILLLVAVAWMLARRAALADDLDRTRRSLSARVIELETLHSVSLEMLASLEPERICAVVDRECRKIFPVDFTFVALTERDGSELVLTYHRSDGEPATEPRPLGAGFATKVIRDRRGCRIARFDALPEELRQNWVGPGAASAMAVPLIVEDRVIGVISVQSRRDDAYDDHQLALLTTMAQQSAVAIENARHYQMATVDSLTGFFHRDYFFRRVEEEYRRVQRYGGQFALLMIDLDGFKRINDDYGHLVGDRYLETIARTISAQLRGADLACRYGGDEFCLLLPETSFSGGTVIAERIREAVSATVVDADGVSVRSTSSIGLAAYPEHDAGNVNGLLRNADEALYRAKRDGRNCVKSFAA